MKSVNWQNYCMKKFGGSIRKLIAEAYVPFAKAQVIKAGARKAEKAVWISANIGRC